MDRMGTSKRPSPWSDLLPELAGLVLRLLPCHIGRLRFRCVCRRWRLAERQQRPHLPSALPFVCVNYRAFLSLPGGEARRVAASATPAGDVSCCGCFDGWLLYGPRKHDSYSGDVGRCFLTNPLTGATVEMPLLLGDRARTNVLYMSKSFLCSSDLIVVFLGARSVAFYRPSAASWSLCPSDDDDDNGDRDRGSYEDVAFYSGKIYALNAVDDLFVHDVAATTVVIGAPRAAAAAVRTIGSTRV